MSNELTQQAFDALYAELKQYREDFLAKAERPLLLDLLLFYDSMNWMRQTMEKPDMSGEVLTDSFQYLMDEFLEILYRRNVNAMEPMDHFDRSKHRAIKVRPAETPDDNERIARVLKRGFLQGDQVLRPEEVEVFRATSSTKKP
jgi:molecular chaperone GrpE (heat shock protein)